MPQKSGGRTTGEQTAQQPRSAQDRQAAENPDTRRGETTGRARRWFANTAVRIGLTLIGVVLLIFALGQAVGLPFLDLLAEAVSSETGRWLVVAFFAVLLIGAAQRGLPSH